MHGSGLCKVARLGGGVRGRICFDLSETLGKGERLLLELLIQLDLEPVPLVLGGYWIRLGPSAPSGVSHT